MKSLDISLAVLASAFRVKLGMTSEEENEVVRAALEDRARIWLAVSTVEAAQAQLKREKEKKS